MKVLNKIERYYVDHIHPTYEKKNNYLRKRGAQIGDNTRLNCTTSAFGSEPYLISVGKDCLFAANINLITHDGAIKVLNTLNKFDGKLMDKIGAITIGNNVYIGMGAYIMPGVTIGDNCIIGAGSIITKNIPDNSIVVGIPGRVICDVDNYWSKNANNLEYLDDMTSEEKRKYLVEKYMGKKSND